MEALPYVQAAGTVMNVMGSMSAANTAQSNAGQQSASYQAQAASQRAAGLQALAEGTMAAREKTRQGAILLSNAVAMAAANGGSVTDPSLAGLLTRNAGKTAYEAAVALYSGQEKQRAFNDEANMSDQAAGVAIATGNAQAKAYRVRAFSDLLGSSTASTLFSRFGSSTQAPAPVETATPVMIGG
jgi:hypothetical protein